MGEIMQPETQAPHLLSSNCKLWYSKVCGGLLYENHDS
jgi:hypothetical protein